MGNAILAVVKEYVQFEDYPPQQQTKIVRKPVQITTIIIAIAIIRSAWHSG